MNEYEIINGKLVIHNTSLEWLNLSYTGVTDISALAGCKKLERLNLSGTLVTGISALAGCKNLKTLSLSNAPVTDTSMIPEACTIYR